MNISVIGFFILLGIVGVLLMWSGKKSADKIEENIKNDFVGVRLMQGPTMLILIGLFLIIGSLFVLTMIFSGAFAA